MTQAARVYAFNPRLVRAFKKALTDTGKSDISDAYVAAERLRFGRLPAPFILNQVYQPLQRLADIVALYLNPPENAVVASVDEKPAIQALERAQGWLHLPDGQAVRGFSHEYKRLGTTTLFAALEVATGLASTGHYRHRRQRSSWIS